FVHPVGRQGHVHPSGEEVLGIPFTLAVAEQYELVGHVSSVPHHRHYSVTGTTPREPAEDSLPAQQDCFAGAIFRAGEPRSGPVGLVHIGFCGSHIGRMHMGAGTAICSATCPIPEDSMGCTPIESDPSPATST